MKVVIAMDSFKGSMTSLEAGNAAKKGVLSSLPDAQVLVFPLADGGEGTVDALTEKVHPNLSECEFQIACDVDNPLCGKQGATYFAISEGVPCEVAMQREYAIMNMQKRVQEVMEIL